MLRPLAVQYWAAVAAVDGGSDAGRGADSDWQTCRLKAKDTRSERSVRHEKSPRADGSNQKRTNQNYNNNIETLNKQLI